jgi:hypothetical protein
MMEAETQSNEPMSQDGPHPAQNRRSIQWLGHTEAEVLARYPQLRDMAPLQRLRRMVRYAWSDWTDELLLNAIRKSEDEAT